MLVLAAGASTTTVEFYTTLVLLGSATAAIVYPFRRLKGGEQGSGSKGGAEKAIVGVLWLLGAIFLGVLVATR